MGAEGTGVVVWFTGLSGAGKSTLAAALADELRAAGRKVEVLDGDAVREHLSKGLGFSRTDRDVNVARIAYVAHLLARNGVTVLVAAISPFREAREAARKTIGDFLEVHVSAPLGECIKRDVKGLYERALAGHLPSFTGVNDAYEEPASPDLRVDTSRTSIDGAVAQVLGLMRARGHAPPPVLRLAASGSVHP